uniref:Uncharacterized protein n=1 Tax=Spongospora subterranea TaxID=70186 RepID=A0A0H5QKL3_9EUKA|eukprot:CRZ02680.1 hypothetical protein [Spongospora subterranea]
MLRNNFQNLKDNNEAVQHPDHHPTITPVEFNDGNGFSEPLESLVNRESNTENGHGTEEAQRQAENVHDMEEAQRQVVQASQDGIVPEVKPNRENEPIYDDVREQPLSHGLFANQDQNVESQLRESDLGVNQSKCLKDSSVQHSSRDHHQAISSILVRVDGLLDNMTGLPK